MYAIRSYYGGHGQYGDILDGHHLLGPLGHLLLEKVALAAQEVGAGLEAQVGFYPCQHHRRADGLGDVVHRPQLEAQRLVFDAGLGGEKDDGDPAGGGILLQPAAVETPDTQPTEASGEKVEDST